MRFVAAGTVASSSPVKGFHRGPANDVLSGKFSAIAPTSLVGAKGGRPRSTTLVAAATVESLGTVPDPRRTRMYSPNALVASVTAGLLFVVGPTARTVAQAGEPPARAPPRA